MTTETLAIYSIYLDKHAKGIKRTGNVKCPERKAYSAMANMNDSLRLLMESKSETKYSENRIMKYLFEIREYIYLIADAKHEIENNEPAKLTDISKKNIERYYSEAMGIAVAITYLLDGIELQGFPRDRCDIEHFFAGRTRTFGL